MSLNDYANEKNAALFNICKLYIKLYTETMDNKTK